MRNLKKFLAVIVVVAMMASFALPAFAADTTTATSSDASACSTLGVLKGDGNGVDATYLAKGTTRLQAAIITLRLMGKEQDALAYTGTENFKDAAKYAWAGGKAIMGYLYANQNYGWQGDKVNFNPDGACSTQMIDKVVLTALGYKQDTDFKYADAISFAATKGIKALPEKTQITNSDMATAIIEALKTNTAAGKTLAQTLVDLGVIKLADAQALGLVAPAELAITDLKAVGASKLQVTFNGPADKAAISVKRGTVSVSVKATTFNTDKTVATIETTTKLLAADYTVSVDKSTKTVTVVDEKLAKITLDGTQAKEASLGSTKANIGVKAFNQYDEDITTSALANTINWTAAPAATATDAGHKGTVEITNTSGTPWIVGTSAIILTGVDQNTGTVVSSTVTIVSAPKLASFKFNGIKNVKTGATDQVINQGDTAAANYAWVLDYTAVDQYGAAVNSAAFFKGADGNYNTADDPVKLNISKTNVTYAWGSDPNDSAKAAIIVTPGAAANAAETDVITAVDVTSGAHDTVTVKVDGALTVATFSASLPSDIITAKKGISIPFTAFDQSGNAATAAMIGGTDGDVTTAANNPVTFTPTGADTIAFSENPVTHAVTLTYTPAASGTRVLLIACGTKVQQLTFNVLDEAVPTVVSSISKDAVLKMTNGASATLDKDDIVVKDQYDRAIDLGTYSGSAYTVVIAEDDNTDHDVTLAGGAIDAAGTAYTFGGTASAGTKAFTAKVYKAAAPVAGSDLAITAETVAKSSIKEYKIDTIGTVYDVATHAPTTPADYAKTVTVYGYTAANEKVALIPITTNTNDIQAINVIGALTYAAGKVSGAAVATDGTDETATVLVAVNGATGVVTLRQDVTVSSKTPVATKIELVQNAGFHNGATEGYENGVLAITKAHIDAAAGAGDTFMSVNSANALQYVTFKVTDQYGVTSQVNPKFYYISEDTVTNANTYTIVNTTGELTVGAGTVAGDEFTVTAVTANGLSASLKVVIK